MSWFGGNDPQKPNYIAPTFTEAELASLKDLFDKFSGQKESFESFQDTILDSASKYKGALEKLSPGFQAGMDKTDQIAASRMDGLVGADTAGRVQRSAAYQGLLSGGGRNASMGLTARDLGRTELELQDSGMSIAGTRRGEERSFMPMQALNLAFTPGQIAERDDRLNYFNTGIKNMQAQANADAYNANQRANYEWESNYGGNGVGALLGGLGGGAGGAALGAVVGSFVFPGIGTAGGALIGGGLGMSTGGSFAGQYGGAQGRQLGTMFGGLGSSLSGFGALGAGGGMKTGYGGYSDILSKLFSPDGGERLGAPTPSNSRLMATGGVQNAGGGRS
jgi:hypothetical protein